VRRRVAEHERARHVRLVALERTSIVDQHEVALAQLLWCGAPRRERRVLAETRELGGRFHHPAARGDRIGADEFERGCRLSDAVYDDEPKPLFDTDLPVADAAVLEDLRDPRTRVTARRSLSLMNVRGKNGDGLRFVPLTPLSGNGI
jgi:hypothetical protein